jgi:L-aminopeptidase/D-esterase-like protein
LSVFCKEKRMATLTNCITDVPGITAGHAQDLNALTGCSVILCEAGAVGGVDQRGGAPGTRETDALRPMHLVNRVHGIILSGGSAFGLDAASGVMRFLEEKGIGYNSGVVRVPIVSSAILFDLGLGDSKVRPDAEMGYQACQAASKQKLAQGNVGVGTGASVGKLFGMSRAVKTGVGCASVDADGGLIVGALVAVNAFGDIVSPQNGTIIAGARSIQKGPFHLGQDLLFADTLSVMKTMIGRQIFRIASSQNTMIGVVASNARLTREETNKVAQMAQDGLAMTVRPAHTMFDGDTLFALSTQHVHANVNIVGALAAQVVAQAIINGVLNAEPAGGLPSAKNLQPTS